MSCIQYGFVIHLNKLAGTTKWNMNEWEIEKKTEWEIPMGSGGVVNIQFGMNHMWWQKNVQRKKLIY